MSIHDFNNLPLGYAAASLNHVVAVLFPPHPCAVAPSEITRCHEALPPDIRRWVNRCWGSSKQAAARHRKHKNS